MRFARSILCSFLSELRFIGLKDSHDYTTACHSERSEESSPRDRCFAMLSMTIWLFVWRSLRARLSAPSLTHLFEPELNELKNYLNSEIPEFV